jgi:hypothetical protein
MAKGKHKRKKNSAQQETTERPTRPVVMESKKVGKNQAEPRAQGTGEASNNDDLPWWKRFWIWAKSNSSFTDWCIAAFTAVLAAAAIYQFIITDRQLDVMRKDERAWVVISSPALKEVALKVGVAPTLPITITNTGKTSATDLYGQFYVELVPNCAAPHFESTDTYIRTSTGLLLPNAPVPIDVERKRLGANKSVEPNPITDAENIAYTNGNAWIAEHGFVQYRDVFGVQRWTKYCFFCCPQRRVRACGKLYRLQHGRPELAKLGHYRQGGWLYCGGTL